MAKTGKASKIEVKEITENASQIIEDCLGKKLKTDPEKQKIFIVENDNGTFAIFITSNANPKIVNLNIFPGLKATEPELREGIDILRRILPDIYNNAEKIITQIKDNDSIVKQALCDFNIKDRFIVYEKTLSKRSEKTILKKIAEEAQEKLNAEKIPTEPVEAQEKNNLPVITVQPVPDQPMIQPVSDQSAIQPAAKKEKAVKILEIEIARDAAETPPEKSPANIPAIKINADDEVIEITTNDLEGRTEKNLAREMRQDSRQFNAAKGMIRDSITPNTVGKPIAVAEFLKNCGLSAGLLRPFLTVVCKNINRSPEKECKEIMTIERIIIKFTGTDPDVIEIDTEQKQILEPKTAEEPEEEKQESAPSALTDPSAAAIVKTLKTEEKTEIAPEIPQPKKEENKKTTQEKIEIAARNFRLIPLQKSILEALKETSLSEIELRKKIRTANELRGQLLYLQQLKLIKQVKRGYELNLQS